MTPDGARLFLPRQFANELKVYPREKMSGMKALADVSVITGSGTLQLSEQTASFGSVHNHRP